MSTQRAVDKWGPFFPCPSSSLYSLLSLSFILSSSFYYSYGTANVPDSTLLRSNLVEFSWVDILLSSRAYLYLAFESSGPFARFANCTIALAFYALHEKERKRERERYSPSFPIRDGDISPYILGSVDSRRMRRALYPFAPWNPGDAGDG